MTRRRILLASLALGTLLTRISLCQERPTPPAFLGEKLRYVMTILGIVGGELILTAEETQWDGRPAYRFELSALSNDFLSKFFLVRDDMVSWVDPRTFHSLRFEKHSVEGKRVRDELTEFDYEHGTARIDGETKPLLDATLDTLSSVYYLRTLDLDKAKPLELAVFSRQSYLLRVEVQARERISTPAGTFETVRVEPKSEGANLLGKNLVLWLTDDDRKVPVQIKSKLKVGTLIGKLKAIEHKAAGPAFDTNPVKP